MLAHLVEGRPFDKIHLVSKETLAEFCEEVGRFLEMRLFEPLQLPVKLLYFLFVLPDSYYSILERVWEMRTSSPCFRRNCSSPLTFARVFFHEYALLNVSFKGCAADRTCELRPKPSIGYFSLSGVIGSSLDDSASPSAR